MEYLVAFLLFTLACMGPVLFPYVGFQLAINPPDKRGLIMRSTAAGFRIANLIAVVMFAVSAFVVILYIPMVTVKSILIGVFAMLGVGFAAAVLSWAPIFASTLCVHSAVSLCTAERKPRVLGCGRHLIERAISESFIR